MPIGDKWFGCGNPACYCSGACMGMTWHLPLNWTLPYNAPQWQPASTETITISDGNTRAVGVIEIDGKLYELRPLD